MAVGLLKGSAVGFPSSSNQRGFTLIDVIIVLALLGIIMGMAVPALTDVVDKQRLGQAAREVERELQIAKQRAVANNRPMRVRFNCPASGWYRMVELIGTTSQPDAADGDSNKSRCDSNSYPYPAADNDPVTRPNLDGPPKKIDSRVTFGSVQTVEFWPDGTARYSAGTNPWALIATTGLSLTLTYKGNTTTIQVNGLGKISRN